MTPPNRIDLTAEQLSRYPAGFDSAVELCELLLVNYRQD